MTDPAQIGAAGAGQKHIGSTVAALGVARQLAPERRQLGEVGDGGDGDQQVDVLRVRLSVVIEPSRAMRRIPARVLAAWTKSSAPTSMCTGMGQVALSRIVQARLRN
jgi:hypothetical protein